MELSDVYGSHEDGGDLAPRFQVSRFATEQMREVAARFGCVILAMNARSPGSKDALVNLGARKESDAQALSDRIRRHLGTGAALAAGAVGT